MEFFLPYKSAILILGIIGFLSLIQLLIADLYALKTKHTPGYPIKPDHNSFIFRAARAHSNTNESIAIFVIFLLFGMLSTASAQLLYYFSLVYLVGRILHMIFYYMNMQLARSASFLLILISLFGMFAVGVDAYL